MTLDLDRLVLDVGRHDTPDEGMCVMEAAALYASEDFTDTPECVSPVVRAFCVAWNDALPDEDRTRLLRPFVPRVVGTNTGRVDDVRRAWMACDWLVRTFTPAWLRVGGLDDDAAKLAALPELTVVGYTTTVSSTVARAQHDAKAAWRAAGGFGSIRLVAWDAAWEAAGTAAGSAAQAATHSAGPTARNADVWHAVWAAAWDAAEIAAAAAVGDTTGDAAKDAARAALANTVAELQESASDLLDRMCTVGKPGT